MIGLWRVSDNLATLDNHTFSALNLPPPSTVEYKDHTSLYVTGEGGDKKVGYANVSMLWDILTADQLHQLATIIETVRQSTRTVYMTIDRGMGNTPGEDWVDISGVPHAVVTSREGNIRRWGKSYFTNVTLFVNAIQAINDPSQYL